MIEKENSKNKDRNNNDNQNGNNRNRILAIICALLFAACLIWLVIYQVRIHKAADQLDEMKDNYVEEIQEEAVEEASAEGEEAVPEAAEETEENELEGYDVPEKIIDFDALNQENEDIYAWITIPGTVIDYPVLQKADETDYYLDHNLDGSSGYPGCIYTQYYNKKDWSDPNTVLYGHNMKDGTMFAALHHYKDPEFFEQNPYVYIYTKDRIRVYEIFAAYEFSDAHLLLTYDLDTDEGYESYLESIFENTGINNHFREDIEPDADSRILSMETCIGQKPTKRYVVQAVLVAEGDPFVMEETADE